MIIYTDGSAHPNPGPGGFGIVITDDNDNIIRTYAELYDEPVTNNEMELKAILWAMENYGQDKVEVCSDSSYAINTYTTWMFNWADNGWINSKKKTPENLDIILKYYDLYNKGYRINLTKVIGHAGIRGNELADKLATGKEKAQIAKHYTSGC